MNIKTKFNFGDRIYSIHKSTLDTIKCTECHGKRELKLKSGKTYTCPECKGLGRLLRNVPRRWILDDDRIENPYNYDYGQKVIQISIEVYSKEHYEGAAEHLSNIKYFFPNGHYVYESDELFKSKKRSITSM